MSAAAALAGDCPTGKIRYRDETEARRSMAFQRRRGRTELTTVYLCSRCDGFHLTSSRTKCGRTR